MENNRSSDTIDLSKAFIYLIRLFSENIATISITLIACLGLGWVYFLVSAKTYESKMIIQSDILSESYSLKLAENLDAHIKGDDIEFLSANLHLTQDEARLLKEFKIVSALTPMSQQMQEKDKIIVVISVRIQDNSVLPKLQAGIISYFSNNEYIKHRVDENRKKFQGLVSALDREIKMMDTLKMKISKGDFSSPKIGGVSLVDVSGLFEVAGDLYEKKHDFMVDLATVDSIQVIEGFTPYSKAVWPKLSITIVASLALAGLIIFIILSYKTLRRQPAQ
jgi:hypothetical protein